MAVNEKRTHFRKSLRAEAWIVDVAGNAWRSVELLDISCGGAAFVTGEELAVGSSHMFRFQLPGNPKQTAAIIKIVYSTEHAYLGGYRVGVEFARIHADDLARIAQFVEDRSSGEAS